MKFRLTLDYAWKCLLLTIMCLLFKLEHTFGLHAKGPPTVLLNVENFKTGNGILTGLGQLNIWCQAVDGQSKRPVPIKSASFKFGTQKLGIQKFDATISSDGLNASLVREKVPATETGTWRCDLQTNYGSTTGNIMVYVRPVVHANSSLRIDEKDGSKTRFEAAGSTVVRGDTAKLVCPVFANPKAEIIWRLDNSRQILGSGETLTINKVEDHHDGNYVCTATNTIGRQKYETIIERRLRIKSETAWLLPLLIILIIIILLITTICFCEMRKKRNEQKLIVSDDD